MVTCLIGLIFIRGYPHSVLPAEAKLDPSGLFQIGQIERWASENEHTIVDLVVVGEDKSRPLRPTNPAFQVAHSLFIQKRCPLVIYNICRLYDGATLESAKALTEYLQETKLPVISAAHRRLIHTDPDLLNIVLADRLNKIAEREASKMRRAGSSGQSLRVKPEAREQQKDKLQKLERIGLTRNIAKIVQSLEEEQSPIALEFLARELNEKKVRTPTGKEWTVANLRKVLKKIRGETGTGTMWQHIKM